MYVDERKSSIYRLTHCLAKIPKNYALLKNPKLGLTQNFLKTSLKQSKSFGVNITSFLHNFTPIFKPTMCL